MTQPISSKTVFISLKRRILTLIRLSMEGTDNTFYIGISLFDIFYVRRLRLV